MCLSSFTNWLTIPRNYLTAQIACKNHISYKCLAKYCISSLSSCSPTSAFFICNFTVAPTIKKHIFDTSCYNLITILVKSNTHYICFAAATRGDLYNNLTIFIFLFKNLKYSAHVIIGHIWSCNISTVLAKSNMSNSFFHRFRNFIY